MGRLAKTVSFGHMMPPLIIMTSFHHHWNWLTMILLSPTAPGASTTPPPNPSPLSCSLLFPPSPVTAERERILTSWSPVPILDAHTTAANTKTTTLSWSLPLVSKGPTFLVTIDTGTNFHYYLFMMILCWNSHQPMGLFYKALHMVRAYTEQVGSTGVSLWIITPLRPYQ